MCDYDLIEYYQLLQEDSEKIDKELSKLDDIISEIHRDNSLETSYAEKLTETARLQTKFQES